MLLLLLILVHCCILVTNRYRVVMLGEASVGKTALVSQFMTSEYMHTYDASLGECNQKSKRSFPNEALSLVLSRWWVWRKVRECPARRRGIRNGIHWPSVYGNERKLDGLKALQSVSRFITNTPPFDPSHSTGPHYCGERLALCRWRTPCRPTSRIAVWSFTRWWPETRSGWPRR